MNVSADYADGRRPEKLTGRRRRRVQALSFNIWLESAEDGYVAIFRDLYSTLYRTPGYAQCSGALAEMRRWFREDTILGAARFKVHYAPGMSAMPVCHPAHQPSALSPQPAAA